MLATDLLRPSDFAVHKAVSIPEFNLVAEMCQFSADAFDERLFQVFNVPFPRQLRGAVANRKAEHLAGRLCAARALAKLSVNAPVLVGPDRAPIWPEGTIGSISHTGNLAIAVCARSKECFGLGIDAENLQSFTKASIAPGRIVDSSEQALLNDAGIGYCLAFSIKESFFKASYPIVQQFFDFSAIKIVDINPVKQTLTLETVGVPSAAFNRGDYVTGSYAAIDDDHIVTALRCDRVPRHQATTRRFST